MIFIGIVPRASGVLAAGVAAIAGLSIASDPPRDVAQVLPPPNGPRIVQPSWHALRDVTAHCKPGETIEHATIVFREGRVLAVIPGEPGPDGKPGTDDDVPAGAPIGPRVWDGAGLHVYPAFIDPFVEVEAPPPDAKSPGQHWNGRVTPQRRATDGVGIDAAKAESLRKMGFGAAGISPAGGLFRGTGAAVSLAAPSTDISLPRPPVYREGVYQAVGLDGGGRRGAPRDPEDLWGGYPGSQMGAIALIRQTFIDVDEVERRGERAPECLEPLRRTYEYTPILFDTSDELDALRAVKIGREFNRRSMVVGSGLEFRRLGAIVERFGTAKAPDGQAWAPMGVPVQVILPLSFPKAPEVGSIGAAESVDLREMMTWEQAPTNPRRLDEAGITVSLTSSRLRDGADFTRNLQRAIRFGLAPERAMAMLTVNPAKALGIEDRLGTIEPGKVASFVVADGDLFVPEQAVKRAKKKEEKKDEPKPEGKAEGEKTPDETKADTADTQKQAKEGIAGEGNKPPQADPAKAGETKPAEANPDAKKEAKPEEARKEEKKDDQPKPGVIRDVWIDGQRHIITPPKAGTLEGEWAATLSPHPKDAEGKDIPAALVFDKDNALTIKLADKSVKALALRIDGRHLSFIIDDNVLGLTGRALATAVVEGESVFGDVVEADGTRLKFVARKQPPREAGAAQFLGTWRVAAFDGNDTAPNDPNAPILDFAGEGIVLVRLPGDDRKFAHSKETRFVLNDGPTRCEFRYEGAPIGTPGEWVDVVKLENGVLSGETTSPGGKKHTYRCERVGDMPEALRAAATQAAADLKKAEKKALKPRKPGDISGTYILTLLDDARVSTAKGEEHSFIVIREDGTIHVYFRGEPVAIRNASVKAGALAYEADVRVEGRAAGDFLIGTMQPANSPKHSWKAARIGPPTDKPLDITRDTLFDDRVEIGSLPEKLPLPFGAYGVITRPEQRKLIFRHGTVWTGSDRGVLNDAAVAIDGGKIVYVGPDKAMSGYEEIDCAGKHITAGIIDCHSHTGISRGVNEGGQAVTAEVRIADVTNPDSISWYRQLAGGVTAVNNLHGSANPIGGQSQTNKNRWGAAHPDDLHFEGAKPGIKFALGENVKRSNSGDGDSTRYPNTRMGVEALIRDRFVAAREYAAAMKSGKMPARDLELEALAEILAGERLIHCHSYRQDEILMLARLAREFGFKLGTYQHNLEGYKVAKEVGESAIGASLFSDWWAYKVEVQDAIPFAGPIMNDVGVVVSYNSDSDELARRLNTEAGKAVRYGVKDPHAAWKFVTANPARQLMVESRTGSLQEGLDADVVVWSADPMLLSTKCERTYVDGRELFSLEGDAAARLAIKGERQRLIQKLLNEAHPDLAGEGKKDGASESKEGDAPSGDAPRRGRRGRPPQEEVADMTREFYMDLMRRGIPPGMHMPGVCGCEELQSSER